MDKINIFLASSYELKEEREKFEIEINRKNKAWFDRGIFLNLDIWEDLPSRYSTSGSQSEYNKFVKSADIFIMLADAKIGKYTNEEFDNALTQFKTTGKPSIYIYFKNTTEKEDESLSVFKAKLSDLIHFPGAFSDFNDLWRQFNIELDRIFAEGTKINKFLSMLAFKPDLLIGRDEDLMAVYKKLFEGDNLLLLVNGEGGIGKTTLAARYYYKYQDKYDHLAWVFAERSLADALLTLAIPLRLSFPDMISEEERLNILFDALRQLKEPCLLIIDNANDIAEMEKYYRYLRCCPNFHLLLTTRITEFENVATYKLEPLSDEKAIELFKKHYPGHKASEDSLLKDILQAVGKNTLVIELIAKTLNNFNQLKTNYSLGALLKDLQEKGLFGIKSGSITTEYHSKNSLRKEKPEDIIKVMYVLSELSEGERQLQSIFSVLPAENIAFAMLETLLPEAGQLETNLLSIARKGWLDYNKELKSFKASPVVQEICRSKNTDLHGDCRQLISILIDKLDYEGGIGHFINATYTEANVYSRYAESILHNIRQADYNIATLNERVGNYHKTTGNLEKALSFYENYMQLKKELYEAYPQNEDYKNELAISYQFIGNTYTLLGDLDKALCYYEKDMQLTKDLYVAYPQNVEFKNGLAISYSELGTVYSSKGDLEKAQGFYENYMQLEKELYEAYPQNEEFKNLLAISYSKLGGTYTSLGNLDKALDFYKDENTLFKKQYEAYPQNVGFKNGLAISYQNLGYTYTLLGDLDKALGYYEKDMQLTKELYEAYPQNVEFKNGLAISYQFLGNIYTSNGDLEKALSFYENYMQLKKELYETYPQNVGFKNGLAVSYHNLGETYTSLGDLEKALSFYENYMKLEKELYEDCPQNVEFKNNLAISYSKLGLHFLNDKNDKKTSLEYFKQAEQLWVELVRDFPNYAEFSKNLKWVRGILNTEF